MLPAGGLLLHTVPHEPDARAVSQGKDRSALVVLSYLVAKFGVTPDAAYNFIQSKRPIVSTRDIPAYWQFLCEEFDGTALAASEAVETNGEFCTYDDGADIDQIMSNLFLGDKQAAGDLTALRARGVTHVVNCSASDDDATNESIPNYHEHDTEIRYFRVELQDNPFCPLLPLLQPALDWIDAALAGGGTVFLHCHAGSSRSGAVTIGQLMRSQSLPFEAAAELARSYRSKVHPNAGFRAHLRALQTQLVEEGMQLPALSPLTDAEADVAAQDFADRRMMEKMSAGEYAWSGYEEFKARFKEGLMRGETDWVVLGGGA